MIALDLNRINLKKKFEGGFIMKISVIGSNGKRTGKFIIGGEEAITNSKGESYISYEDYAIAMVDEIENAKHINERFSIVAE